MKTAYLLLNLVALSAAFTSPTFSARRVNRVSQSTRATKNDNVAVLEREEVVSEAVAETKAIETTVVTQGMPELELDEDKKEMSEAEKLMTQVKDAGIAGVMSYALWEMGFWTISVPICVFGYREVTGHWPDFQNKDDLEKLGAETFAFVNFARFAVPLRIGLALGTTPWIQENVVDKFMKKDEDSAE